MIYYSPSRTPIISHGGEPPELPLLSFQQTISRGDAQSTALAITTNSGEYPYDSGEDQPMVGGYYIEVIPLVAVDSYCTAKWTWLGRIKKKGRPDLHG